MKAKYEHAELIYDGRIAKGYKVQGRMPDGHLVQRDFVHYGSAAVVLPVLDDGSIVLIRNYRFAVDEHLCELPAGMIDEGEDPAAGAARELAEEPDTPHRRSSLLAVSIQPEPLN
jgi:ADP-ribose pyrophosphatase